MALLLIESVAETLQAPTTTFVLLLAIALLFPPIFERLKLPGLVGLLVAGVVFGGSALGWLDPEDDTMKLLSDIGKIYLMFVAGLEIDLALFQRTRNRSLSFGALTFVVPFISGIAIGLFFGFGWLAAVLIGSLLASHTLLAYPIVQRVGVVSDEAVTVTVGATIFTDIAALVVLAICLGISQGDFTASKLIVLLGSLGLYAAAVLMGLKRLAHEFFRANGQDEGSQFLFVMLSVFLAAVVAQLIGVEGIIGAFLAGLAINSVLGNSPVKEKIEFVGSVLFIPMFFINMGLLLDLKALGSLLQVIALPIAIVGMLLISKFLAALGTKQLFGYSWLQTWAMWSLSIPQVAATLAAALVGYEANIINVQVFNSVILLMLVTSIMGPLVTAKTARRLALSASAKQVEPLSWLPIPASPEAVSGNVPGTASSPVSGTVSGTASGTASESNATVANPTVANAIRAQAETGRYTVIVPVHNPTTEPKLLELAAMIAQYEQGQVVPLAVALAQPQMDSPRLKRVLAHSRHRLWEATAIQERFSVPVDPVVRIDYSVPQAICHVSREREANLIVLGMGRPLKFEAPLLTTVHDDVLWSAHCPVLVARLLASPTQLKNILLPIETPSSQTIRILRLAQVLAAANQGKVTLLHVFSPFSSQSYQRSLEAQLHWLINQLPAADAVLEVKTVVQETLLGAVEHSLPGSIAQVAQDYDLVILRSQRRRHSSGLSLGTTTGPLIEKLTKSVILVGEPYAPQASRPIYDTIVPVV